MLHQVTDLHRIARRLREHTGHVPLDGIVEAEHPAVDQLHRGGGRRDLGHGEPEQGRVHRHRSTGGLVGGPDAAREGDATVGHDRRGDPGHAAPGQRVAERGVGDRHGTQDRRPAIRRQPAGTCCRHIDKAIYSGRGPRGADPERPSSPRSDPGRPRPPGGHLAAGRVRLRARSTRPELRDPPSSRRGGWGTPGDRCATRDRRSAPGGRPRGTRAPTGRRAAPRRRDPGAATLTGAARAPHRLVVTARSRSVRSLPERIVAIDTALADVPHAFGGALSLAYYAEPRATVDIDLNLFVPADRYAEVAVPLVRLGVAADAPDAVAAARRDGQTRVMWDGTPIDMFFAYDAFHDAAAADRRTVPFATTVIPILAPEHLVVCKVVFDRPRLGRHRRHARCRRRPRRRRGDALGGPDRGRPRSPVRADRRTPDPSLTRWCRARRLDGRDTTGTTGKGRITRAERRTPARCRQGRGSSRPSRTRRP